MAARRDVVTQAVDQVLFGYRNGHELLASSRRLSSRQQRELLPHMDASFEGLSGRQLVGASIPSVEGYLLAGIWPAPERPRPGAVWAHGLLLTGKQLESGHLGGLLALLRRPTDEQPHGYDDQLRWLQATTEAVSAPTLARALTWSVLVHDPRTRVVLWHTAREAEEALLALLDAFPAAARKDLSFRTRERARFGGSPYSVQVASGVSGRTAAASSVVIDARRPPTSALPDWTSLLDATQEAAQRRAFLHRYGDQDARTRQQVSALVGIASWLAAEPEPPIVVARLVQDFPQPHDAVDLRLDLLGAADTAVDLWSITDERRLALLIDQGGHFDVSQFDVDRRVAMLWRTAREKAIRVAVLALEPDVDDAWRTGILDAFATVLSPKDIAALSKVGPVLEAVLDRRPEMLREPTIWRALSNALASQVLTEHGSRVPSDALANALVGTPALLRLAVDAVPLELEVAMRHALRERDETALRALAEHPDFASWLVAASLSSVEAERLLESVPLARLQGRGSRGWWPLAMDLRSRAAARPEVVLLAFALDDASPDGDRLLELTFAPVHRTLAEERLDQESWSLLDDRLPKRDDWDRAGRLRRAVIKRATAGHWDAERLSSTLSGAGPHGARVTDLVGGKHPLRKALDSALHGIADIFR